MDEVKGKVASEVQSLLLEAKWGVLNLEYCKATRVGDLETSIRVKYSSLSGPRYFLVKVKEQM